MVSSPFSRLMPSSSSRCLPVSRAASSAARALSFTRRAVGRTSRVFGLGAGQQRRDQRARRDSAGEGDAAALRRACRRHGRARPHRRRWRVAAASCRRLRWCPRYGWCLSIIGFLRSCFLRSCSLRALRDFRFSPTPPTIFPARSISGSRARNMAIAATTPVAASGRARTASTASSARSAPFSFAPCQASRASDLGAEPLLQLVRGGHDPGAAAFDLGAAAAISGVSRSQVAPQPAVADPAEQRRRLPRRSACRRTRRRAGR